MLPQKTKKNIKQKNGNVCVTPKKKYFFSLILNYEFSIFELKLN